MGEGTAPHILAVTLPGYKSEVIVRFLSDRGICLSSGSVCHKGKPSHVYAALKLPKKELDGVLRISFSYDTTLENVTALAEGLKAAQEQLGQLYEKALGEVGEDNAAIFEIHQMMLEDEDFLDAVRSVIRTQGGTAEHAVQVTGENFAAAFAASLRYLPLSVVLRAMIDAPARILGMGNVALREGAKAQFQALHTRPWTVEAEGRSTPFEGMTLVGGCEWTIES